MAWLSAADCLHLWEAGRALHPIDRGLLAIHRAFPDTRDEDVADWPIGERNRLLARLQCASFGPLLAGCTSCPACREELEFEFDAGMLAAHAPISANSTVDVSDQRFRLPTSRDLASLAGIADASDAALRLAQRCHVPPSSLDDASAERAPAWDEAGLERIGEQLAEADPCAEILLQFDCPQCHAAFKESLDLAAFLWNGFEARARRLLREVHALAGAYGWSEQEILALTPARRGAYLDMVLA